MSNISVPYEIIVGGKQDEYLELEIEHQELQNKLWELGRTQKECFGKMEDIVSPRNKYGHQIAYKYEDFRKLKAWKDIVILKAYVEEALEREGVIQELNARYIEVREKIKVIYRKCGLNEKHVC